ncbi:MAG: cyclic nucleotide-binding domain-containing protein [Stellaceae bacterium]
MSKQPALNIRAPVWAREPAARPQSIPQALEALAQPARYQRDEEIYSLERSVECWYRVVSGAARRFALRADGRRQTVDLLLPGDFFGFGVHGKHAFTGEAIAYDTVIARYPVSRVEMLAASDAAAAGELAGIISRGMSRLHSVLLIIGRTTAERALFKKLTQSPMLSPQFESLPRCCRRQKHCDHAGRMIVVAIQKGADALIDIQYPMPA